MAKEPRQTKGFCYFLPGVDANIAAVRAVGVPCLADDGQGLVVRGSFNGPGGAAGALAWNDGGQAWQFQKDAQLWAKVAPATSGIAREYWVGHRKDALPGPEDLARPRRHPGVEVTLAGRVWFVPQYRVFPVAFRVTEEGTIEKGLAPAFQALCEEGVGYLDARFGVPSAVEKVTDESLLGLAARVLGLNYRVGKVELVLLNLSDTRSALEILDAFTDFHSIHADFKKKQEAETPPAPLDSGSGLSAETPATPRPSGSSSAPSA